MADADLHAAEFQKRIEQFDASVQEVARVVGREAAIASDDLRARAAVLSLAAVSLRDCAGMADSIASKIRGITQGGDA